MKKESSINEKYSELRGFSSLIASKCGCSAPYVLMVLRGERVAKTRRAVFCKKIYQLADELLKAMEVVKTNNTNN